MAMASFSVNEKASSSTMRLQARQSLIQPFAVTFDSGGNVVRLAEGRVLTLLVFSLGFGLASSARFYRGGKMALWPVPE